MSWQPSTIYGNIYHWKVSSMTYKLTTFENPMKLVTLLEMPINVHFQPLTWGPLLQQRPPPQLACCCHLHDRLQPWAAPTIRKHHQGQDHQTDWRHWFKVRNCSKPNFIEKDTYDKLKKNQFFIEPISHHVSSWIKSAWLSVWRSCVGLGRFLRRDSSLLMPKSHLCRLVKKQVTRSTS